MDTRNHLSFRISHHLPRHMLSIQEMELPNQKAKETKGPNLFPLLRVNRKRGLRQRRQRRVQGRRRKGNNHPNRKPTASPKPAPSPSATSPTTKPGGGNSANRSEKRLPGKIKKQCVPYTLPSGCVSGNNCPFQHANDPVTKKTLPPLQEDIDRYQAALNLAHPNLQLHLEQEKSSTTVPTIKMIRVNTQEESEEEPDPEQPASGSEPVLIVPRPPGNHPNPEGRIDLEELMQRVPGPTDAGAVCRHMRSRSLFADIIYGGNQHGRW